MKKLLFDGWNGALTILNKRHNRPQPLRLNAIALADTPQPMGPRIDTSTIAKYRQIKNLINMNLIITEKLRVREMSKNMSGRAILI